MKKLFLSAGFVILATCPLLAQVPSPFSTAANIDINNINARHMVHGDMWWNPATGNAACEFPKGAGKQISFASALWMGGYDQNAILHVAAQTYRQNGNDYWPGPLDAAGNTNYATESNWAQIWKVDKSTIDSFRMRIAGGPGNVTGPQYDVIKQWPAVGNADAVGTNGNPLNLLNSNWIPGRTYAPFVDLNGDGIYEWTEGEYPRIKGDQMLWWVVNDAGSTHNETNGMPMGFEIQNSAYAYHRGGLLENVVFYEFLIFNRSSLTYDSLRLGLWSDVDLGNGFDDYIGFDSSRRMGVCYNSGTADPTVMGISMLELPDDTGNVYVPAGSFSTYNNTISGPLRNPAGANEYFNLIHPAYTTGAPYPSGKKYFYGLTEECDSAHVAGDRRFIISSGNQTLQPNGVMKIGMALLACTNGGGCPNTNFSCLQNTADSAFGVYHNGTYTGIADKSLLYGLRIYPNPAQDRIFIQTDHGLSDGTLKLFDIVGRQLPLAITKNSKGMELNIAALPKGCYTVTYADKDGAALQTSRFVKQ